MINLIINHYLELDWTEEEAALIEEFTQMLSSTPRDGQVTEETTFLRPTEMLETARSLLSTTNTAVVRGQNSITFPSDQSVAAKRLKTFADLLPRESLNPPKLEQATSFEDLLSPPVIYEESESGTRQTIDLDKKRKMIAEALERMKKKEVLLSGKIKFPPVRPEGGEDKFADYEDSSTWGPVTEEEAEEEEEYTTEYEETGQEMIKQIMEDHTENNFGLGILSVPNMMETTLLKLLNKSQKEEFSSNDISLNSGDSERSSELNIVSSRDPLNKNIGDLPQRENFELTAPRKQNPLLSLLEPVRQDYSDDIFSAPDYRQDPLLRLLQKNPKRYQDDFLQLPPKQQTQLLKIFMRAGPGVDIDQLVPPDYKQNPLLRLLVPQYTDHIDSLTPPRISQNTIMRALLKEPGKFANDFLILSDGDKEEILDLVDQANDATFNIELLIPSRSERLRILQSHSDDSREPSQELPASKRSNPLLEFLEGDKRDEREKEQLTVPLYRQDPLLRQLRVRPEKYREDFLALPARAQQGLLRKLREHGVPRWNIDRLTPPDFDQNPLIRMIQNKDNKFLPKENSIVMDLIKNPEDFTEDFSVLSHEAKEEVVEMIHKNDDGSFEMAILIPDKSERLKMMTKNPLLRFLEANKQDDQDKVNFVPPKYRQDPLLRQLRLRPEMYQSDFLELPRRKQDTLLKLLKNSGLESTLMERLLPPGSKQDPLLRALIGDNNDNIGNIKPPSYKQNPLVRLLRPDKTDKLDRDRLTLPQKEATFKQLLEQPQTLASEFDELSQEDQEKLVDMVEKSGKDTEKILNKLPPRKSERLTVVKDPLIVKNIPKYTQSDAFREIQGNKPPAKKQNDLNKDDEAEKDSLRLPVDPLLEEVMTNPGEYKNAFDKLPSNDQETLMKILSEESGSIVVEDFFEAETLKKNPDFSSDVEG